MATWSVRGSYNEKKHETQIFTMGVWLSHNEVSGYHDYDNPKFKRETNTRILKKVIFYLNCKLAFWRPEEEAHSRGIPHTAASFRWLMSSKLIEKWHDPLPILCNQCLPAATRTICGKESLDNAFLGCPFILPCHALCFLGALDFKIIVLMQCTMMVIPSESDVLCG